MTAARGLPEGCPPDGSVAADGEFYRLTRRGLEVGATPPVQDWTLPLNNKSSEGFRKFDECDAYSHSVFMDLRDLLNARLSVAWTRKKSIARLALAPAMGRVHQTPSDLGASHHDWWPSTDNLVPTAVVVEGSTE